MSVRSECQLNVGQIFLKSLDNCCSATRTAVTIAVLVVDRI